MKRYGKKEVIEALKDGLYVCYYDYMLCNNAGYKVIDRKHNIIGYITYTLFYDLLKNDIITVYVKNFSNTVYGLVM